MFNLITLVKAIEKIGTALPNVNTVVLSDIYKLNELPDIDYSVFAIVQDIHRQDNDYFYFNFYLYYVDRLLNDKSNQLEIQSHGIQLLSTVISKIEQLGLILNRDLMENTYQSFNQRFSDECAGVFARIEVQVPIDCTIPYDVLVNPLLADLSTWEAGVYNPEDFGVDAFRTVTVSGQSLHYYTENEGDKTATIDNGHHNINVTKSGATYDGYQIVNTQTLSAYTYNKNDVLNLTQYEIGQALSPVKAQVSANTEDIAELSGSTMALSASTQGSINATNNNLQNLSAATQNAVSSITDTIQALSAATEGTTSAITQNLAELSGSTQDAINAITGQISAITDEIETVSANTIANANGIETLSAATQNEISAITENLQTLSASTIALSGQTVTNTNDIAAISGNTYNKNETDDRISQTATYYYNQLEPRVAQNEQDITGLSGNTQILSASTVSNANDIATLSGLTSANTASIAELSGNTIALSAATQNEISAITQNIETLSASTIELSGQTVTNTNDIASVSAATSSNTVDIIILSGQTSANTGNINILSGLTSANTENLAELSGSTVALSGQTVTNTNDIATLSGLTSANTQNIAILSGQTSAITENLSTLSASTVALSAMTDDFVEKVPTLKVGDSAETLDFNTLTTTGFYNTSARDNYCINAPYTDANMYDGILQVISNEWGTNILQLWSTMYQTNIGEWPRIFYRVKCWDGQAHSWSLWEEFQTDKNAMLRDIETLVGSSTNIIDFNDFSGTTSINYFIRSYSQWATNAPITFYDGIMELVKGFDGNGLQRFTTVDNGILRTFIRYLGWNGWTTWYEYTLTPVNQQ